LKPSAEARSRSGKIVSREKVLDGLATKDVNGITIAAIGFNVQFISF
jgi:hypothetical protein